jgi:hypothetical protein
VQEESGPLWPDPYDYDHIPRSTWRNQPERVGMADDHVFSFLECE